MKAHSLLRVVAFAVATFSAAHWLSRTAAAEESAAYFRQNCVSCHTIGGGRLVGPDLKGVTTRRDRSWLVRFLLNPRAVIESGDPYAAQLLKEANGVVMPTVSGMTQELANALLDLIEEESAKEHSQFEGVQISDRPFTAQEVARGRELFAGQQKLGTGGPMCAACHTSVLLSGLGGGRLGPDLSRAFEKLQGRRGLAAWLSSPATPTMRALFLQHALTAEEIMALVAFLEASAQQGADDGRPQGLVLVLFAFGGLAVCVVTFDALWKGRLRTVRKELISRNRARGGQ